MLVTNPHVKYIRICESQDAFGQRIEKLIIDTNLENLSKEEAKNDLRLIELAAHIKEFQLHFRDILGTFRYVEVTGNRRLLLNPSA